MMYVCIKYLKYHYKVIKVLSHYCDYVERASIDEAFLDVTSLVMDRLKVLQQTRPQDFPLITSSMLPATHVAGYTVTLETDNKGDNKVLSICTIVYHIMLIMYVKLAVKHVGKETLAKCCTLKTMCAI